PKNPEAAHVLVRLQRRNPRRASGDEIRETQSPLRQSAVVLRAQRLTDQAGLVQEFPEPVRVTREVMADRRRAQAGVNADEQYSRVGTDGVGKQRHVREEGKRKRQKAKAKSQKQYVG